MGSHPGGSGSSSDVRTGAGVAAVFALVALWVVGPLAVHARSAADSTRPVVSISTPAAGATIGGTVVVSGTATDDQAVRAVHVVVDDRGPRAATGTTSWSYSFDAGRLTPGPHTITARATDRKGNRGTATITITVAGSSPSPSPSPSPSTSAPSSSTVVVRAGSSIAQAIASNPAGTSFQLEAGTYAVPSTLKPKAGDSFIGMGKGVTILDGRGASFSGVVSTSVRGVRFAAMTVRGFYDGLRLGPFSLVEDVEVHGNGAIGIQVAGDGSVVRDCDVHDNGRFGIYVNHANGVQVLGNAVTHNHTSSSWDNGYAGGIKVTNGSADALVQGNTVTDTQGRGIWTDDEAIRTRVAGNTVLGSTEEAIRLEISFDTVVEGNVVDTGINVLNSTRSLVTGNVTSAKGTDSPLRIAGNGGRGYANVDNRARGNDVKLRAGQTTGVVYVAGTSAGNRFEGNVYHVPDMAARWFKWWTGSSKESLTWSGWQGVGQDLAGQIGA